MNPDRLHRLSSSANSKARGPCARLLLTAGAALALLSAACADVQGGEESVARDDDELYGLGSLGTVWKNGQVPVCFENYSASDARVDKIRWILTDTWSAVANLSFTGFGTCPSSGNRVIVKFGANDFRGNADGLGQGVRTLTLMANDDTFLGSTVGLSNGSNLSHFRYEVIHEFGHALGFKHEQQRPDNWTYAGNGTPLHSIGCTENTSDLGNWLPKPGGTYLSSYDANSVMNYCAREPGSTSGFVQNLSPGDVTGVTSGYGVNPQRARSKRGILWRNQNTGSIVEWHMTGTAYSSAIPISAAIGTVPDTGWQVKGSGDFDGDGIGDILWRHSNGQLAIWYLNSGSVRGQGYPGAPQNDWSIQGTGDFNADGRSDILWRHSGGQVAIWWSGLPAGASYPGGAGGGEWAIQTVGDFDGDHFSDILWRANNGQLAIWGRGDANRAWYPPLVGNGWVIKGAGDFNGDGKDDILWRAVSGQVAIWPNVNTNAGAWYPGGDGDNSWSIIGVGDFDSDGKSDVLWRLFSGQVAIWWSAVGPSSSSYPGGDNDNTWAPQGTLLDLSY